MTQTGSGNAQRDAAIVARVLDDGLSYRAAADEAGISHERARQIVMRHREQAEAELAAAGPDEAALRVRYAAALEIVDTLEPAERWVLLAAVLWPSEKLLAVSRQVMRVQDARAERDGRCRACGCDLETYSFGCRTCRDRRQGRRRRERDREARA